MSQVFYHTKISGGVQSADRSGTETSPVPWQMIDENIMDMYVLFSAGGACYKQKTVENPKFYAPQKWCEARWTGAGKEKMYADGSGQKCIK